MYFLQKGIYLIKKQNSFIINFCKSRYTGMMYNYLCGWHKLYLFITYGIE